MRRLRGFTLVEVLMAVAILGFVVAGITTVLIKQSQASTSQVQERDMEASGRLALLELARAARLAGYGITPVAAFDFDRFACTTPGSASTCPNGGRDRIDGPDEMVVAYRDPDFARSLISVSGAGPFTVTVDRPLTVTLKAGRIVQILCAGAGNVSYLALSADAAAGATTLVLRLLVDADGYFTPTSPIAGGGANACFATGAMFLVERTRYYVAADTDGVPALFRDRGRGAQEMLYRGIEDLQISYDIGQPPIASAFAAGGATPAAAPGCVDSGTATWSFGSCVGVAGTPIELAVQPDWQNDAYDSANRYTGHPVNIRTVNINVVARAIQASPDGTGDPLPILGNRAARVADNFHRTVLSISEQPANLLARALFLPPVFPNSNVGGG